MMASEPVVLVTPYFKANDSDRQRELDECLARNVQNPLIGRIVLMIDDGAPLPIQSEKIVVRHLLRRPTYADWLDVAEEIARQSPVVLANSDIYFDESIALLHEALRDPYVFVALSRWEIDGGKSYRHPNPKWSQDTWAIRIGDAEFRHVRKRLSFELGVPRCDNKVAYVFATSGWSIRNPCDRIRSYHLHESQVRNYDKKGDTTIVGGVAYVEPTESLAENAALHFDIWSVKRHDVVKVSVNNSLEKWRLESSRSDAAESRKANSPLPNVQTAPSGSKLSLFKSGERIYFNHAGMAIYENGRDILAAPSFDPREWSVLKKGQSLMPATCRKVFKPVIDVHLDKVTDRPKDENDVNFWQYPCLTEKQAYLNHLSIHSPRIDHRGKKIRLYAPIPWATYIDNKQFPEEVYVCLGRRIEFLNALAGRLGYSLEIHTVCQHIRWRDILEHAERVGVTNLSISHCTVDAQEQLGASGCRLRVHPWSLYAVNYCDKTRNPGLEVGKPIAERRYLASFIGAHMSHYLSDIRVRLFEEVGLLGADDVIVDLTGMWHFNQVVYDNQVSGKYMGEGLPVDLETSTIRYNHVLSNTKFSLCPEGAGPNTLRFWESIAIGCVPVLFNRSLAFPEAVSEVLSELCLFWTKPRYGTEFFDWLKSFSAVELERRSRGLMKTYRMVEKLTCI